MTLSENVLVMVRFGVSALLIILSVFVIAVLTPKLASLIDKIAKKNSPERVQDSEHPDVKGIYDGDSAPDNAEENNDENGDA